MVLGAGNIGDKGQPATERKDRDIIPDSAVRLSTDTGDYHTGRGGAGNEHTSGGHSNGHGHKHKDTSSSASEEKPSTGGAPMSLADKLKTKLFGAFK